MLIESSGNSESFDLKIVPEALTLNTSQNFGLTAIVFFHYSNCSFLHR